VTTPAPLTRPIECRPVGGRASGVPLYILYVYTVFLRCFRDPTRVPRIENRVARISEYYHRVPRIREKRAPRIR